MKKCRIFFLTAIMIAAGAISATASPAGPGQVAQNKEANTYPQDLREFKFSIAGEAYQLPISYRELVSKGWKIQPAQSRPEIHSEQQLIAGISEVSLDFCKDDMVLHTTLFNGEPAERQLMDLDIVRIHFSTYALAGAAQKIALPGGIVPGTSSEADVRAAYGAPSEESVGDGARYFKSLYNIGENQSISLEYNNDEHHIITDIYLTNEMELYRKVMGYMNNYQLSAEASAYVAPSALGSDISKGLYEFGGDVYQFPAPLKAYLDNGWKLEQRELCAYYVEPGDETGAELVRGNERFYVSVRNNGAVRDDIRNCVTTLVTGSEILPKGIRIGTSRNALLKALSGVEYTVEDQWNYIIKCKDPRYEVLIFVSDYDDLVSQVMICNAE